MDKRKEDFITALNQTGANISEACAKTGVPRSTFYLWRNMDDEFNQAVEDIGEAEIDFVESCLKKNIRAGDTTAQIFYLKTRGKKRGWSEKLQLQPVMPESEQPTPQVVNAVEIKEAPAIERKPDKLAVLKRIKNKKDYLVKVLRKQGKYTPELAMQVDLAAQLLVRTDMLRDEIYDVSHSAVNVEISREGNRRETVSPKESLYRSYLEQSQSALRAIGMNFDAKERKSESDSFNDFMNEFKKDDE